MPIKRPLMIAALAMAFPCATFAGFVDETAVAAAAKADTAPAAEPAAPAVPELPVRLEGDAPRVIPPAKGKGRRIPVGAALTQITPANYRLTISDRIDSAKLVDWTGRPQWITTLTEIVKDAGLVATINWQRQTVTVKTSFDEADKPATWTLKAGDRVSARLDDWAKQNGWQLAWEVKELVVEGVDMSATGTFMDAVGAFVEALNIGGAEIRARFYMDNSPPVLRVTERVR